MSSEMIERVARAIYRAEARAARYSQDQIDAWEQYPQSVRDKWAETAKAAIDAMREPTKAMIETANEQFDWGPGYDAAPQGAARSDAVWSVMIDAALA